MLLLHPYAPSFPKAIPPAQTPRGAKKSLIANAQMIPNRSIAPESHPSCADPSGARILNISGNLELLTMILGLHK